jgi:hypothetical protein
VAGSRDKFDAERLPDPELNPLLNPLLAAHMGRWAEVYFTSPPERRGQAVSDLLRQLRSESPRESVPSGVPEEARKETAREHEAQATEWRPQPPPAVADVAKLCRACSAENSAQQRFCGMCGAALHSAPPATESTIHAIDASSEENWSEPESSANSEEYAPPPAIDPRYDDRNGAEPEWQIPDSDLPSFAVESESVPYRFRLYLGLAVALLLAALVYMKWHGMTGASGDVSESAPSRVIPAAPAASTAAQEPAQSRTVLPTDRGAGPSPASSAQKQTPPETNLGGDQAASPRGRSALIVPVAANSPIPAPDQNGAEEFATAQKYLNGSNPTGARDNREAAQWLWKAVGKGNVAATLVLSDLFLRGDGVAKSCDQARLLLDAAARKGKASAAERLRNLQAFGCQ